VERGKVLEVGEDVTDVFKCGPFYMRVKLEGKTNPGARKYSSIGTCCIYIRCCRSNDVDPVERVGATGPARKIAHKRRGKHWPRFGTVRTGKDAFFQVDRTLRAYITVDLTIWALESVVFCFVTFKSRAVQYSTTTRHSGRMTRAKRQHGQPEFRITKHVIARAGSG
jgi:hypothetical protein